MYLQGFQYVKLDFRSFGKYNSVKILTSYSRSNIPTKTNKNPLKSHPSTFHGGMRILLKSGRCVEFGMRLVSHGQWISSFPSRGGRKFWRAKKEWCEWSLKGDSYKEGWRWYEESVFQCGSKRRKDVRRKAIPQSPHGLRQAGRSLAEFNMIFFYLAYPTVYSSN